MPPTMQCKNPNDHALLVGINDYAPGIPSLSGSHNDCKLFERWLTDPEFGGLDSRNIKTILSPVPFGSAPKKDEVVDCLVEYGDLIDSDPTLKLRRLYVFFSGHGITSGAVDSLGTALAMGNSRPSFLRGLPCAVFANAFRLSQIFRQVVLVVDCCAEVVGGRSDLKLELPFIPDPSRDAGSFIHIQAARMGATTSETELPDPFDPSGQSKLVHGVLTNAVIRAFMSAVDEAGQITAASVKRFLKGQENATPEVDIGDGRLESVDNLTFGSKVAGLVVTVQLQPGTTRYAVRDGLNFGQLIAPRAEPKTISLAPGLYLIDGLDDQGTVVRTDRITLRKGGQDVSV